MTTFSQRQGYKPDRSKLYQFESIDTQLRNAIWNFLLQYYLNGEARHAKVRAIWINVRGRRVDELSTYPSTALNSLREWYLKAPWDEVYDCLEYLVTSSPRQDDVARADAMLQREGSAYRFVNRLLAPITNEHEIKEVEVAARHPDPFLGASQQIGRAIELLNDRNNPDFRNAIKEAISAVESVVSMVTGVPRHDISKGLARLEGHPQLKQAWKNMYNWTSDEDGIRHAMIGDPNVGLAEARYMVVACSAFVNYLLSKHGEGS